jgi:ring-1,2-phenylacetyl-CoA epoxidase subunit PaaE
MEGAEFHSLEVADVERLTDDAVAVTFAVPADLVDRFRYRPGQHVTVRASIDGEDVRRSYSICADATTGTLRVGIKRLPGGTFSTWANESLEVGQQLGVATPVGEFTIEPERNGARHYGAVAAGSGITPVLSLISTTLAVEPQSRFTLLYGNQESRTIMFLEELEGLKDRYPDRFHLIHVLSREDAVVPLFSGRLDRGKLEQLLDAVVDDTTVDDWYLCGPHEMVETARLLLTDRGFDPGAIHDELFFSGPPPELPPDAGDDLGLPLVRFTLDGRTSQVRVPGAGAPILDYALTVRRELPFSCRGGMCTSCRARVVTGEVRLDKNWSLTTEELESGQVLTCQAHPVTDDVELTYDL